MHPDPDDVANFRRCWLAILPGAIPGWWSRVRNVQANRARYGPEWPSIDSRWAAYDRARGHVTSPAEDDAVRSFLLDYRPDRDCLAHLLTGHDGQVGAVSLLMPPERMGQALADLYRQAIDQHLRSAGVPPPATRLGATAYVGPLLAYFQSAADQHRREVATRIGPDATCRRLARVIPDKPILVMTLLRADFHLSLAEAAEVYRRAGPPTGKRRER